MFVDEFKTHLKVIKRKDELAIKSAKKMLEGKTRRDRHFARKVNVAQVGLKPDYVAAILREYISKELGDFCFNRTFNESVVRNVLNDREFIAMLIKANLINRARSLERHTKGQVKLRIYVAILNFANYKRK